MYNTRKRLKFYFLFYFRYLIYLVLIVRTRVVYRNIISRCLFNGTFPGGGKKQFEKSTWQYYNVIKAHPTNTLCVVLFLQIFSRYGKVLKIVTFTKNSEYTRVSYVYNARITAAKLQKRLIYLSRPVRFSGRTRVERLEVPRRIERGSAKNMTCTRVVVSS